MKEDKKFMSFLAQTGSMDRPKFSVATKLANQHWNKVLSRKKKEVFYEQYNMSFIKYKKDLEAYRNGVIKQLLKISF